MTRYQLKQVMDCKSELSSISEKSTSQGTYYVVNDSHFTISSDGTIIVGVDYENQNCLQTENISDQNDASKFPYSNHGEILTMMVNWELKQVLTGCDNSIVKIHSLDTKQIVKDFGSLDFGWICSGASLGNLAVIGGKTEFKLIDWNKQEICELGEQKPLEIGHITCLELICSLDHGIYQTNLTIFGESSVAKRFEVSEFVTPLTK